MVSGVSIEDIVARVKVLIADILEDVEPGDVPEEVPLFEVEHQVDGLEMDSLDSLKLAVALAEEYDLDPAVEIDYSQVRTVREIAEYVRALMASGGER